MPLIGLWLQPLYRAKSRGNDPIFEDTREFIQYRLANALPFIFVDSAEDLGLGPDTPQQGIQVTNHEYGLRDVNTADVWLDIRFSEARPNEERCKEIRDNLYALVRNWFIDNDVEPPDSLVIDLAWGPTHGKGTVDGVEIEW